MFQPPQVLRLGPKNLPFWPVPRWCRCHRSGDHTLRITAGPWLSINIAWFSIKTLNKYCLALNKNSPGLIHPFFPLRVADEVWQTHSVGGHLSPLTSFSLSVKWEQPSSPGVLGWTKIHFAKHILVIEHLGMTSTFNYPPLAFCTFCLVWTWIMFHYLFRSCFPGSLQPTGNQSMTLSSLIFYIQHLKNTYRWCW